VPARQLGIRNLGSSARRLQLDSYLTRIVTRDLGEQGITLRRPQSLRAWMEAYAAATCTTASYSEIQRAAQPGDADPPTKVTTITYRDWLTQLWILDPLAAWTPRRRPLRELGQAPKHQLADPALAARLLRVTAGLLLSGGGRVIDPRRGPLVGQLFEALATVTVRVLAQAGEALVSHLRTRNGDHEVDLIVERYDGRLVAMKVKLGGDVRDSDVRHLRWLGRELGDQLGDTVVLTTGEYAYRRPDGVAVVPLALLGP
jgi:predicted AAA+ superfamily ATPase